MTLRANQKVHWGVLGVANIAVTKVIPGMQRGSVTEITAIASRDLAKAQTAAAKLGITTAYGSYEELLADPEIEAIYNPLPNHLHVPWSIRAMEAGKHVLCEKPIGLSVAEADELIRARDAAGVKASEAFMTRVHPQWLRTRDLVRAGAVGEPRIITGFFSYFNRKPENVRNIAAWGGGALMDIGCYPITLSRMVFGEEPQRVIATMDRDPDFRTDRYISALMEYSGGKQCTFTCSTQLCPYQRMIVFGTTGRVELEIPFNAPPDRACRILVNDALEEMPVCDQYTVHGDL